MRSILIILYVVCFVCYILFTRQPDYFDSERTSGNVVKHNDLLVVQFSVTNETHYATIEYPFLYNQGELKEVIYENADPSNAKLYSLFGYWLTFGEVIASLIIVIALYYVAVSITRNPTPEALIEEMEIGKKKPRKPKYDT